MSNRGPSEGVPSRSGLALSWPACGLARRAGVALRADELRAVEGLWGRLCARVGWKEALSVYGRDAESLHAAIEPYQGALAAELESCVAESSGSDSASVFIADDVCSSQGWLLDPKLVAEVLVPAYAQVISGITGIGFHSDGDISELFVTLRKAGFQKVHLASIGYTELRAIVRRATESGLQPYGGIAAETLSYGVPSEEICRLLIGLSQDEGLVISDDAGITDQLQLKRLQEAFAILTEL